MERLTCQKKIILDYLKSVQSHPSAEKIFKEAKKKLPQISLGTVYRNLNTLKEKGEIQEILAETARWDGDISKHSHFICQKCGKVIDIFENIGRLNLQKIKVGKIKNYQIYLFGDCKNC